VGKINPAIPSSGPQCTRGVVEFLVGNTEGEIFGILERDLVELVVIGIVLDIVILHSGAETIYVFEIGLYVGSPFTLWPGGS
jgi:hypothetical protein